MWIEKLITIIDARSTEQPHTICFSKKKMKEIEFALYVKANHKHMHKVANIRLIYNYTIIHMFVSYYTCIKYLRILKPTFWKKDILISI